MACRRRHAKRLAVVRLCFKDRTDAPIAVISVRTAPLLLLHNLRLDIMNDLALCDDMTGIPIQQRLEIHAEQHKALWAETESLEYAHDALKQCKKELEKSKAALKKQQRTEECWEYKLLVVAVELR